MVMVSDKVISSLLLICSPDFKAFTRKAARGFAPHASPFQTREAGRFPA
jgi:hypothetical protein